MGGVAVTAPLLRLARGRHSTGYGERRLSRALVAEQRVMQRDHGRARAPIAEAPVASARATAVELAGLHALVWLALANAVGVLLALLLVWPAAGTLLGGLGYGRWVPLHLDLQLYGWCSLPLVALLLRFYSAPRGGECPGGVVAVGAWSAALVAGSVSWLAGGSSGKLFLEWSGMVRAALPVAMLLLLLALVRGWLGGARRRAGRRAERGRFVLAGAALLLALLPVPVILYWATSPTVYPAFNPDSGGATGSSLLGSSLGIVAVLLLAPVLAGLPRRPGASSRSGWPMAGVLALHFLVFALGGHGARSHHEPGQRLLLLSLAVWVPLVVVWLRSFEWPEGAGRWLTAAAAWSGVLLATSWITFQPGVLERAKFTNALVAHAHLAMAGAITSFHGALLAAIHRGDRLARVLRSPLPFWLWQLGCAIHVGALLAVGVLEAGDPGRLFRPDAAVSAWYGVRLLAGIVMLLASISWSRRAWRSLDASPAAGAGAAEAS